MDPMMTYMYNKLHNLFQEASFKFPFINKMKKENIMCSYSLTQDVFR